MTRFVVVAASLGLIISSAGACGFKHSAEAKVDQTVVASVVSDDEQATMSTPDMAAPDEASPSVPVTETAK